MNELKKLSVIDWIPACDIVAAVNGELGRVPIDLVGKETRDLILDLVRRDYIRPGVFNDELKLDAESIGESDRLRLAESWFIEGEVIRYDTTRWFDGGRTLEEVNLTGQP